MTYALSNEPERGGTTRLRPEINSVREKVKVWWKKVIRCPPPS